jgi:hypothetical protein
MLSAVEDQGVSAVSEIPSRFVSIDLENGESVRQAIERHDVDILYVAPLRGVNLQGMLGSCRDKQVVTFTGVRNYLEDGVAVAIGMRGGKPEIVVNLTESRRPVPTSARRFCGWLRSCPEQVSFRQDPFHLSLLSLRGVPQEPRRALRANTMRELGVEAAAGRQGAHGHSITDDCIPSHSQASSTARNTMKSWGSSPSALISNMRVMAKS